MRKQKVVSQLFVLKHLPLLLTAAVAFLAATELLPINRERAVLVLLGLLAVETVLEQVTFLQDLQREVAALKTVGFLRFRSDAHFQPFAEYCGAAQEIFVAGLSLGYLAQNEYAFIEELLKSGTSFKLLVIDPSLPSEAFDMIAEHDERGKVAPAEFRKALQQEIKTSLKILEGLKTLTCLQGHLEVKAARGLPVFTITMVNPRQEWGKMRVELRAYGRNLGRRPYFELRNEEPLERRAYEFFFAQYYQVLWNDSAKPLLEV